MSPDEENKAMREWLEKLSTDGVKDPEVIAFKAWVRREYPKNWEDLLSEASLKIVHALNENRLESISSPSAYMYKTIQYLAISWSRKEGRKYDWNDQIDDQKSDSQVPSPSFETRREEELSTLQRAIRELNDLDQMLLKAKFLDGKTYEQMLETPEIASSKELSENQDKIVKLHRLFKVAMERLRKKLGDETFSKLWGN